MLKQITPLRLQMTVGGRFFQKLGANPGTVSAQGRLQVLFACMFRYEIKESTLELGSDLNYFTSLSLEVL